MTESKEANAGWMQKVAHELKLVGAIAVYVYLTLTGLEIYKGLMIPGYAISDFQLGYNTIEALVLAKVILIGDLLHIGEKFKERPLIVPTLFKALAFGLFVMAFSSAEFLVKGLIHGADLAAAWQDLLVKQRGERLAQASFMFISFIPFFAIWETARALGEQRLVTMFFSRRNA